MNAGGLNKNRVDALAEWLENHHAGFINLILPVFWFHSHQEIEEISNQTAVTIDEIKGNWPRPWLYSRVLIMFVALFTILYGIIIADGGFADSRLTAGATIVGALAFPMTVLIFFYECNLFRSISVLTMFRYFLVGSIVSIFVAFLLHYGFELGLGYGVETRLSVPTWIRKILGLWYSTINPANVVAKSADALMAFYAFFEEFSKAIVIFIFLRRYKNRNYILQGMLVGASVGAGFAVFESVGYALTDGDWLQSIMLRGLMSPACHTAWGALLAGGTMMLTNGRLRYRLLLSIRYILLFLFVCAMHFCWNEILYQGYDLKYSLQLSAFTWALLLLLIWAGVMQIRCFKKQGYLPVEL